MRPLIVAEGRVYFTWFTSGSRWKVHAIANYGILYFVQRHSLIRGWESGVVSRERGISKSVEQIPNITSARRTRILGPAAPYILDSGPLFSLLRVIENCLSSGNSSRRLCQSVYTKYSVHFCFV